jgi:toxin ParE1/3/4
MSAIRIVEAIEDFADGLDIASERGRRCDDLRVGLRIVAFRKATLAIRVDEDTVTIIRVFYGGQDWEQAFTAESDSRAKS